jgi:hypothetical protein
VKLPASAFAFDVVETDDGLLILALPPQAEGFAPQAAQLCDNGLRLALEDGTAMDVAEIPLPLIRKLSALDELIVAEMDNTGIHRTQALPLVTT